MRHGIFRSALAALALAGALGGCGEAPARGPATSAVWVTRWDFRDRADVERVLDDCADAGFDAVLFQVRGNATTYYPSALEPWAAVYGGDPGFDPLRVALRGAHERGMELHAWVNVVPAWWGEGPPADADHVVNAHPEWLWYDQRGERQAYSSDFYVSLNPCLPEVRAHVAAVVEELLAGYELDGLHLDYLRFPNEPPARRPDQDFPRDARTLELFRAETGATPDAAPAEWDRWRCEQVTRLLRELRGVQRRVRPEAELSVAVGPEREAALAHFQDWTTWIDEGLVDVLYPMNYTRDGERFAARVARWSELAQRVRVVMGLRFGTAADEEWRARVLAARRAFGASCLFGYASLFESRNDVIEPQEPEAAAARAALRERLLPFLRGLTER